MANPKIKRVVMKTSMSGTREDDGKSFAVQPGDEVAASSGIFNEITLQRLSALNYAVAFDSKNKEIAVDTFAHLLPDPEPEPAEENSEEKPDSDGDSTAEDPAPKTAKKKAVVRKARKKKVTKKKATTK